MSRDAILFYYGGDLGDSLRAKELSMRSEIESFVDSQLGKKSDDELAKEIATTASVRYLRIYKDRMTMSQPEEVMIDISGDAFRFLVPGDDPHVRGTRIEF